MLLKCVGVGVVTLVLSCARHPVAYGDKVACMSGRPDNGVLTTRRRRDADDVFNNDDNAADVVLLYSMWSR